MKNPAKLILPNPYAQHAIVQLLPTLNGTQLGHLHALLQYLSLNSSGEFASKQETVEALEKAFLQTEEMLIRSLH